MDWEPNITDPQRNPLWYREKNHHGAIRLRVYTNKLIPGKPRDAFEEARAEAAKRREIDGVKNVELDESRQYPLLTWIQNTCDPKAFPRLWTVHTFKVFDAKGSIVMAFNHFSDMEPSVVQEELGSVKEIVNRIVRL